MKPTPDRSLWRGVAFAMPIAIMLWTSILLAVRSCTLLAPTFQPFEQPDTTYHPGPAYFMAFKFLPFSWEIDSIDRDAWTCIYYDWHAEYAGHVIYAPPRPCSPDLHAESITSASQIWTCDPNESRESCAARRPPELEDARYLVPKAK